jgi:hypothetical protein
MTLPYRCQLAARCKMSSKGLNLERREKCAWNRVDGKLRFRLAYVIESIGLAAALMAHVRRSAL